MMANSGGEQRERPFGSLSLEATATAAYFRLFRTRTHTQTHTHTHTYIRTRGTRSFARYIVKRSRLITLYF